MNFARTKDWETLYGTENAENGPAGWSVEFPRSGSVNYVTTREEISNPRSGPGNRLRASVSIRGSGPEFYAVGRRNNEGLEPNCRPMLMRSMQGVNNRWWPVSCIFLTPHKGVYDFPLLPSLWTNVNGRPADTNASTLRDFRECVAECRVGMTFGGGNAHGHGVRLTRGRASIAVVNFCFV